MGAGALAPGRVCTEFPRDKEFRAFEVLEKIEFSLKPRRCDSGPPGSRLAADAVWSGAPVPCQAKAPARLVGPVLLRSAAGPAGSAAGPAGVPAPLRSACRACQRHLKPSPRKSLASKRFYASSLHWRARRVSLQASRPERYLREQRMQRVCAKGRLIPRNQRIS